MPITASVELPETFLYTSFPINTVADLKGKKMRLLGDEAVIFGKLGVAAVATPSPEIYEAMQRGVIDGFQHQNIGGDIRMGFQEIVDYVYMSPARQPTDMYILYVNKDAWAELPDDLKVILTEVGWAEGIRHFALGSLELTKATEIWEGAGASVMPIPQEVEDAVVQSALDFYDEQAAKDPFFKKTLESLRAWRDAYNKVLPRL
jgi:TRAP-type mannitol/chloroaromatic compound transport system substrate-binding protein